MNPVSALVCTVGLLILLLISAWNAFAPTGSTAGRTAAVLATLLVFFAGVDVWRHVEFFRW